MSLGGRGVGGRHGVRSIVSRSPPVHVRAESKTRSDAGGLGHPGVRTVAGGTRSTTALNRATRTLGRCQTADVAWAPDRDARRGRVAVVACATGGAGQSIAAALGEAGAPSCAPVAAAGPRRRFAPTTTVARRSRRPADFALSESPRYVGRAVLALASDPDRVPVEPDITGAPCVRRPDVRRFIDEVRERNLEAGYDDYR